MKLSTFDYHNTAHSVECASPILSMKRIDIVRLRKNAGMSQRELAQLLQVRPSFLSAIENGKSRLPDEKLSRIKEIFGLEDLENYTMETAGDFSAVVPPHTHSDTGDTFTQLLNHFHELAHKNNTHHSDKETGQRIEFLTHRCDRLSERVDDLRDQVDRLSKENLFLKELLIRHNIPYQKNI